MSLFEIEEVTLITQGTKEYLLVDVTDESLQLTTLVGTTPRFDVYTEAGVAKITAQAAVVDPVLLLRMRCLVDTATPSLWAAGNYFLYPKFDTLPEIPRLGPYLFVVVA